MWTDLGYVISVDPFYLYHSPDIAWCCMCSILNPGCLCSTKDQYCGHLGVLGSYRHLFCPGFYICLLSPMACTRLPPLWRSHFLCNFFHHLFDSQYRLIHNLNTYVPWKNANIKIPQSVIYDRWRACSLHHICPLGRGTKKENIWWEVGKTFGRDRCSLI